MRSKKPLIATGITLTILLILVIGVLFVYHHFTGTLKTVEIDQSDDALGITVEENEETQTDVNGNIVAEKEAKDVTTFLLFGINSTDVNPVDVNRSDSIIVVSVNHTDKVINLVSILRDTKAAIEGHNPQKINAAYHFGGAQLAIKTINQNFKTAIRDYVAVDFGMMASIVDMLGGVDIEISQAEADYSGLGVGWQHLTGEEAVLYSRIRKIDNDVYRAGRQQTVLQALFKNIQAMSVTEYPSILREFLGLCETSYEMSDFMALITAGAYNYEIVVNTIPDENYEIGVVGGTDENGEWVWQYDLKKAGERLKSIISGE